MRRATGILAAACILLLAACGGNKGEGGAKKKYIEQADTLCSQAIKDISGFGEATDTASLQKEHDIAADLFTKLSAIPKSTENDEQLNNFLAQVHNIVLTADAAVQASMLQQGAQAAVAKRVADLDEARKAASKTAKDYGFKTCDQL